MNAENHTTKSRSVNDLGVLLEGMNMKHKHRVVLAVRFASAEADALRALGERKTGKDVRISLSALIHEIVVSYIQNYRQQA